MDISPVCGSERPLLGVLRAVIRRADQVDKFILSDRPHLHLPGDQLSAGANLTRNDLSGRQVFRLEVGGDAVDVLKALPAGLHRARARNTVTFALHL